MTSRSYPGEYTSLKVNCQNPVLLLYEKGKQRAIPFCSRELGAYRSLHELDVLFQEQSSVFEQATIANMLQAIELVVQAQARRAFAGTATKTYKGRAQWPDWGISTIYVVAKAPIWSYWVGNPLH